MINTDLFLKISRDLEKHHAIFYTLWEMGKPVFSDEIDTAAVQFDKEGRFINFLFNEKFWNSCSDTKRNFVICHEVLHVLLKHGIRTIDNKNPDICNIALDIVVNHSLVNNFEFNRDEIEGWEKLCWVDTVFKKENIPDNENYEYYYSLLMNEKDFNKKSILDKHEDIPILNEEEFKDIINKLPVESRDILTSLAGDGKGNLQYVVFNKEVIKKKKWETVIKKWSQKYLKDHEEKEQWARKNRRIHLINNELSLPSDAEDEHYELNKIKVWFFQDTSGSCFNFRDRFFHAAQSLPPNRFEIKMHCFDTKVYETSLESRKLYGFGGTRFSIIENYIQNEILKTNEKYPEAVFVITDGFGDRVNPQRPEKWYWFLSTNYRSYINEKCNIFELKNYE